MSSQEELELRARRIVSRLTDTPSLALRLKLGNADVPYLASFQARTGRMDSDGHRKKTYRTTKTLSVF